MRGEEDQTEQQRTLLRRKSAFSVLHATTSAILGTASLMLIARNLGAEVLGIIGFAISLFGIISFLSDFGIGSVHRKILSQSRHPGKAVGAYFVMRLASLAVMVLIGLTIYWMWNNNVISGMMDVDPDSSTTILIFLAYYVLLGISQIATHTFEAQDNIVKSQFPEILDLLLRVGLLVVVISSAYSTISEAAVLIGFAYLLGALGSMILALFLFRRVRIELPDREILREYFSGLSPIVIVSGAIMITSFIDNIFVGYFWGAEQLGMYFGAQRIIIFVTTFALGVAILILPSIMTYRIRGDPLATREVISLAERYLSMIVFPAAAFYIVLSPQILSSFLGAEFIPASETMSVLVIASVFTSFVFPLRAILAAENLVRTILRIQLASVLFTIVLIILFVPREFFGISMLGQGGLGAAFAVLGGSLVSFIGTRWMAWREIKSLPSYRSLIHIAAACGMAAVVYTVDLLFVHASVWWEIIFLAFVAGTAFALISRLTGELNLQDLRYFASLLKPRENIRYAARELLGK